MAFERAEVPGFGCRGLHAHHGQGRQGVNAEHERVIGMNRRCRAAEQRQKTGQDNGGDRADVLDSIGLRCACHFGLANMRWWSHGRSHGRGITATRIARGQASVITSVIWPAVQAITLGHSKLVQHLNMDACA